MKSYDDGYTDGQRDAVIVLTEIRDQLEGIQWYLLNESIRKIKGE